MMESPEETKPMLTLEESEDTNILEVESHKHLASVGDCFKLRVFMGIIAGAFIGAFSLSYLYADFIQSDADSSSSESAQYVNEPSHIDIDLIDFNGSYNLDTDKWTFETKGSCKNTKAGPPDNDDANVNSYPDVLPKRAFSDQVRFVFVMGLEGTGHHMWLPIWTNCQNESNCDCPPYVDDFTFGADQMRSGMFGALTGKNEVEKYVERVVSQLPSRLAQDQKTRGGDQSVTYLLNTFCVKHKHFWSVGAMSYPNFMNGCRSWSNPDVRLMAEIFESLGIDFRVMVIVRDALDVLLSTTVHRHFGRFEPTGHTYAKIVNSVMVDSQLARLDPRFFKCMEYEELPNVPEGMGSFLNVDHQGNPDWTFAAAVPKIYHNVARMKGSISQHDKLLKKLDNLPNRKKSYEALNQALKRLRDICGLK